MRHSGSFGRKRLKDAALPAGFFMPSKRKSMPDTGKLWDGQMVLPLFVEPLQAMND